MYCPTCSKTYGATHSKCPECDCWLKTSGPSGAPAQPVAQKAAPTSTVSHWGQSDDDWGNTNTVTQAPATSGWDAPKEEANKGWLNGGEGSQASWDTPSAEDGWSTPAPSASPQPASRGWLSEVAEEPSQSGWLGAGSEPQEPAESSQGWLAEGPQPEPTESTQGWLSEGPEQESSSTAESHENVDEQWLDEENWNREEMDEYAETARPSAHPDPTMSFFKLLTLVVVCLMVVAGVVYGNKKKPPAGPTAAELAAESLDTGRLYVDGALASLDAKDFENAASQLRRGLPYLDAGLCPQDELDQAYILLAEATFGDGDYLVSRDLWAQLGDNIPDVASRAQTMMVKCDQALRRKAVGLLDEAAKLLKGPSGAKRALTLSEQALNLLEDFDGDNKQLGRAHGLLGRAHLAKRVMSPARYHLIQAERLTGNREYTKLLNKIGRGGAEVKEPVRETTTVRVEPSFVPTVNNGIPSGVRTGGNRRYSRNKPPVRTQTTTVATKQPTRMKEIPAYQRKTNARRGKQKSAGNTSFVNYQDRSR